MKAKRARTQARLAELERIRAGNRRGVLIPQEVVEAARARASPLHDCFEWDDSRAAHEHRLNQARQLIREIDVVFDEHDDVVVPMYLSLPKDRLLPGGGYRPTTQICGKTQLRQQLLQTAAVELTSFQERWRSIDIIAHALGPVLKAHDQFRQRYIHSITAKRKRTG
jgi:hypothetical protein